MHILGNFSSFMTLGRVPPLPLTHTHNGHKHREKHFGMFQITLGLVMEAGASIWCVLIKNLL